MNDLNELQKDLDVLKTSLAVQDNGAVSNLRIETVADLEAAADKLGEYSRRETWAYKRHEMLSMASRCLLLGLSANSPIDPDGVLKAVALYLTIAIEYDRQKAQDGLSLIEKALSDGFAISAELNFMRSQFHLISGDVESAKDYYAQAATNCKGRELTWTSYSFHWPIVEARQRFRRWPSFKRLLDQSDKMLAYMGLAEEKKELRDNPYSDLSTDTKYWKTAVAQRMPAQLADLYRKKYDLDKQTKIMSVGSCFAQHIGRVLKENAFGFLDYEPAFKRPHYLAQPAQDMGYDLYSARYGNIYTARQLRQLFLRAFGRFSPQEDFWADNGRWYDPFRPTIEPSGYFSLREAQVMRASHLRAVRRLFEDAELMIFTMGLTEAWRHKHDGAVYPMCPGTAAGVFNEAKYEFKNFTYREIKDDLEALIAELREIKPDLKILLTVSPVPLTATASQDHVLVATMRSKAVLRAVALEFYEKYDFVDYFPSYDIISSIPFARGAFQDNLRGVKPEVVDFIMSRFLSAHGYRAAPAAAVTTQSPVQIAVAQAPEEQCDEALLEAFGRK